MKLRSPWLHQLNRERPVVPHNKDVRADVVVLGAGIAGVMTTYFLLNTSDRGVLMIDAGKVAHGATGHNGGQLVSYFERPFHDIAREYGLKMAAEGQMDIESSWKLLEQIQRKEKMQTPCHIVEGQAGCVDLPTLMEHLKNNAARRDAGIICETILVSKTFKQLQDIPRMYRGLYKLVEHKKILALLQSKDPSYIATISSKKGCMNSAAFCEELVVKMLKKFPERFQLIECLPVHTIRLLDAGAFLLTDRSRIEANQVVLCTNGFERLNIQNRHGVEINRKFHQLVRGSIGYMAAFLEEEGPQEAAAISYLPKMNATEHEAFDADPYFYLTRRPFIEGKKENLICIAGPESLMDDTNDYHHEHPYPEEAKRLLTRFVQRTYPYLKKKLNYAFFWHGLMGYTPNGLRCVGFEPCNPTLLYNLGCNGVGLLPSVFGGRKIARLLNGEVLPPSIFDPRDQRCERPLRPWWRAWAQPLVFLLIKFILLVLTLTTLAFLVAMIFLI